eukprot:361556-Chlamydomonas_euryale.AAC.9
MAWRILECNNTLVGPNITRELLYGQVHCHQGWSFERKDARLICPCQLIFQAGRAMSSDVACRTRACPARSCVGWKPALTYHRMARPRGYQVDALCGQYGRVNETETALLIVDLASLETQLPSQKAAADFICHFRLCYSLRIRHEPASSKVPPPSDTHDVQ